MRLRNAVVDVPMDSLCRAIGESRDRLRAAIEDDYRRIGYPAERIQRLRIVRAGEP
jgi:hypothetical protein